MADAAPGPPGWVLVPGLYVLCFLLNALVPVRALTRGYAIDHRTGTPALHRLNGLACLLIVLAIYLGVVYAGLLPGDVFYRRYFSCLRAACTVGLAASLGFYFRGQQLLAAGLLDRRAHCPTVGTLKADKDGTKTSGDTAEFDARTAWDHFWCGLSEHNPRGPLGVDVKMYLYLVGAVALELNLLSACFAHPSPLSSPGLLAYTGCLTFFVVEYLYHEEVHLYTYDIFRERIGLKLAWGCFCFYPFFYCIGIFPLLRPDAGQLAPISALCCVALFFSGWLLTRGANLQKFACKQGRDRFLGGLVSMETLPGSQGRILVAGFWGLSRHINYVGELVQATALALPGWLATGSLLPWLYPLYYVLLFVPRALDDDAICEAKYGKALWAEYRRRVPYRIVPGIW